MEKKSKKYTDLGRKITIGKHVMNTIRQSEDGVTVEQLKEILYNREKSVFPTVSEINVALRNGIQRRALMIEEGLYKATDTRHVGKTEKSKEYSYKEKPAKKEKEPKTFICPICLDEKKMRNGASLVCNHIFCMACIGNWSNIVRTCPVCRRRLLFSGLLC